ncbi:hypothetical protein [Mycobacterium sp. DL440]|uniref:hypothetical protein n=1 Tax=Mycobacterium sp. DL440 TaxID=2675523 RepID=UPI0014208B4C|nr:hypothetical protein [Mycobacterium sp. DL440]
MRFNKPSAWRWFWSTVGTAFVIYVATVIVVYAVALSPGSGVETQSSNKYVGLLMWDLAPVFMLSFWFVSIPLIAALGAWWAWTHITDKDSTSREPTSTLGADDVTVASQEDDHEHEHERSRSRVCAAIAPSRCRRSRKWLPGGTSQ